MLILNVWPLLSLFTYNFHSLNCVYIYIYTLDYDMYDLLLNRLVML